MRKALRPVAVVILVVVGLGSAWAGVVLWALYTKSPTPIEDRCEATAGGRTVAVDLAQAHNASIIAGVAIVRGLPPRATSIALTTAYQESGIRNLDYGHADSIGLFQQRPSKGWGTEKQIMDPWYSSAAFYKELVKIKSWKTGDLNDVAQAVQRSAYPEAYRRHVPNARTLASSLSGQTPASYSCVVKRIGAPDAAGLTSFLTKTFGSHVKVRPSEQGLLVSTDDVAVTWAVAHAAVGGVEQYGVVEVRAADKAWTHEAAGPAAWRQLSVSSLNDKTVTIVARKP